MEHKAAGWRPARRLGFWKSKSGEKTVDLVEDLVEDDRSFCFIFFPARMAAAPAASRALSQTFLSLLLFLLLSLLRPSRRGQCCQDAARV